MLQWGTRISHIMKSENKFSVVGGPLDGSAITTDEWRTLGYPDYGGYIAFNRANRGYSVYNPMTKRMERKVTPTRIFLHESLLD